MLPPYQLSVDGLAGDMFRVQSFTGTEALSEAWAFDIVVVAPTGDEVEHRALGRRAVLTFHVGPEPRAFYGVVAAVRLAAVDRVDQRLEYVVRVVPRLWLLKRRRRTRIFQRMRVPDVVAQVLGEAGIAVRFQLTRSYPAREYCTQYEESAYQFVKRILAEAGMFFYFFGGGPLGVDAAAAVGPAVGGALAGVAAQAAETPIPGDTVVCADDAACYPPGCRRQRGGAGRLHRRRPGARRRRFRGGHRGGRDRRGCGHRRPRGQRAGGPEPVLPHQRGDPGRPARQDQTLHPAQHGALHRGHLPRLRSVAAAGAAPEHGGLDGALPALAAGGGRDGRRLRGEHRLRHLSAAGIRGRDRGGPRPARAARGV